MIKRIFNKYVWWKWCLVMPIVLIDIIICLPIHLFLHFFDWLSDHIVFYRDHLDYLADWAKKKQHK